MSRYNEPKPELSRIKPSASRGFEAVFDHWHVTRSSFIVDYYLSYLSLVTVDSEFGELNLNFVIAIFLIKSTEELLGFYST